MISENYDKLTASGIYLYDLGAKRGRLGRGKCVMGMGISFTITHANHYPSMGIVVVRKVTY